MKFLRLASVARPFNTNWPLDAVPFQDGDSIDVRWPDGAESFESIVQRHNCWWINRSTHGIETLVDISKVEVSTTSISEIFRRSLVKNREAVVQKAWETYDAELARIEQVLDHLGKSPEAPKVDIIVGGKPLEDLNSPRANAKRLLQVFAKILSESHTIRTDLVCPDATDAATSLSCTGIFEDRYPDWWVPPRVTVSWDANTYTTFVIETAKVSQRITVNHDEDIDAIVNRIRELTRGSAAGIPNVG